ncbi:MAG TPA: tRNA (5-methylaminomethyl-2-thiouridine)(34)-methyltransferase MnmD [Methylotenera sp.]|nr:tRNA (5-methylaminomethyl-2-thiouridine)(34)-methyltransferase MnmD [Methylotenera sp.]
MQNLINTYAKVEWRDNQPYSTTFGDVYFSSDNGLLETEYVFLQGNHLASRWQQLAADNFTLIETGFGTSLNFLCAVKLWLNIAPPSATLHFISVEKHPLTLEDISVALQSWADLESVKAPFFAQYSSLLSEQNTISLFDNRIHLTLLIGDATEQLQHIKNEADAWFLDGFAPAKNPDIWQPALFAQMARLSHRETTFATFTSAGIVRRGLIAAGFDVTKQAGFGKKREMLTGIFMNDKA